MLPVPGRRPVAFLATLLESLPLAIPVAVHRRQPEKYLRPYTQLIEWGSEPNTSDMESFLWPQPGALRLVGVRNHPGQSVAGRQGWGPSGPA